MTPVYFLLAALCWIWAAVAGISALRGKPVLGYVLASTVMGLLGLYCVALGFGFFFVT